MCVARARIPSIEHKRVACTLTSNWWCCRHPKRSKCDTKTRKPFNFPPWILAKSQLFEPEEAVHLGLGPIFQAEMALAQKMIHLGGRWVFTHLTYSRAFRSPINLCCFTNRPYRMCSTALAPSSRAPSPPAAGVKPAAAARL